MCADWGLLAHAAGLCLAGRCLSRRELEGVRKGRRLAVSELRGAGEVGPCIGHCWAARVTRSSGTFIILAVRQKEDIVLGKQTANGHSD